MLDSLGEILIRVTMVKSVSHTLASTQLWSVRGTNNTAARETVLMKSQVRIGFPHHGTSQMLRTTFSSVPLVLHLAKAHLQSLFVKKKKKNALTSPGENVR